eukprot:4301717-Prymnesium_polylepis.1
MGRVPVARGCERCARSRSRHTHQLLTNARLLTIPPTRGLRWSAQSLSAWRGGEQDPGGHVYLDLYQCK